MNFSRELIKALNRAVVQGVAWVPEYSGNDSTWYTYRSCIVTFKRRRIPCPA